MTKKEIYIEILKEVPFNDEGFTFDVLFYFINGHYPIIEIEDFYNSEEVDAFMDALVNVLDYVVELDSFYKTLLRLVK